MTVSLDQTTRALNQLGTNLPAEAAERYQVLFTELERWGRRVNLTAILDPEEMLARHLLDSLVARRLLRGTAILDVGTGAGFPGLPLAIAEPEREFTLLDSNNKKIMFVRHITGLLGLTNVEAVKSRTQDYAPNKRFDTVIARAVAALAQLIDMAGHHVGEDGVFVALKGRYPEQELQQLPELWTADTVELSVPGLASGSRHAVMLEPK